MNAPSRLPVLSDHCWSRIGVNGDQSCPKLVEFVHCHNCTVFAEAAQLFLDRPVPEGYSGQVSASLAETSHIGSSRKSRSVVIFEVESQFLAIDTKAVVEVTEPRKVHRIGHRSGRVFLGIVNIHGQLELCASLKGLLQIPALPRGELGANVQARMLLVELKGQRWVFPVDAVHGVQRFDDTEIVGVPATVQHDSSSLVSNVLKWTDRRVGLLDIEKAVASLDKNLR
jgi:chemotaxis-related protein WspD